ncbi:unnamed protein product [Timema podura]|uniref:C2H2-type domain-containing protein n=1 Tax=Timema podura TaxID=61482 RepID=A0ABN7NC34_TIMPD|nr:unnamed protein product [Timema podura]
METSVIEGPNNLAASESVPLEQDGAAGSDQVDTADKNKNNVLHCLICNADLAPGTDTTYNVHSALSADDPDLCSKKSSVLDHLRRILERPITVHLHSDIVCGECFEFMLEHAAAEVHVRLMRTRVLTRYERTEQLVITQEGTLVDKHGKENNASIFKMPKTKNERKFVCKVCGKSFRAFSHRVEHMLIHINEKPFECAECFRSFRTKSSMRAHAMKHTGERPHACKTCGKRFQDHYYMAEHERIHSGSKPFQCSFCHRAFMRKKDLALHVKGHTGDKPYKCGHGTCDKAFAVKSRLHRHTKIHSGERPFACNLCDKTFVRRDDYQVTTLLSLPVQWLYVGQVHIRRHTGERPFYCLYCAKTFTNQSNCLYHIRKHKGVFPCWVCGATFQVRGLLDRHAADVHTILDPRVVDAHSKPDIQPVNAGSVPVNAGSVPEDTHSVLNVQAVTNKGDNDGKIMLEETPSMINTHTLLDMQLVTGCPGEQAPRGPNITVTELAAINTVQVAWSDGSSATAYVNLPPGTFIID